MKDSVREGRYRESLSMVKQVKAQKQILSMPFLTTFFRVQFFKWLKHPLKIAMQCFDNHKKSNFKSPDP